MPTRIPLNQSYQDEKKLEKKLDMSTSDLGLTVRTTNCLDEHGIATVGDLLKCKRDELLAIPNFGEKTLEEVYQALEKIGFIRRDRREEQQEP